MNSAAASAREDIELIKRISSIEMILKLLRRSTGLRVGVVASTRDNKMTICAVSDEGDSGFNVGDEADLEATYCGIIHNTRQPLLINDASADPKLVTYPAYHSFGVNSYIGVPIISEAGEMFGTVCTFDTVSADLSEQDFEIFHLCSQLISYELEDERRRIARDHEFQKISESNEVRTKFMSILGHDLKNPLNAITMAARLQQMKAEGNAHVSDLSEKILRSAKTMQGMINDLLDVTRTEDGQLPLTRRPINVSSVIKHCVEEFRLANPDSLLEVTAEGDFEAELDEARVCQLTSNLLNNACRYGDSSRPIRVILMDLGTELILQIQNQGEPIAPENLENLFRAYWRGEKERISHSQGLGLGLYIVNQIVKAHGGNISVTSNAINGTAFTVTLPKHA